MGELTHRSVTELRSAYARGDVSPLEVADEVLALIEEKEPELNALAYRDDPEQVRQAARESTDRWRRGLPWGPMDGIPITVKENVARAGVPDTSGCAAVEPTVHQANSPAVQRIQDAGMVLLGSTTMPDWGMLSSGRSSRHGLTRSPLHPDWTTGGSSSGAGAAAAAGYGPVHVGTDIGGSVRLPGTWLGLSTLKPSAGRIALHAPYLGRVAGPMARSASDAAALLDVLAGPDLRDWTSLPADPTAYRTLPDELTGIRVGLWTEPGYGVAPVPEVVTAVQRIAERLETAGAQIVPVAPWLEQPILDGIDLFWQVRSRVDFARLSPGQQGLVDPFIAEWVQRSASAGATEVMEGYHAFGHLAARTMNAWAAAGDLDFMISPVAPEAAAPADQPMPYPEDGKGLWHINFTVPWNMTGQPAGTTPAGTMPDGRPIGVQVIGRPHADQQVLALMQWLEEHPG